MLTSVVGMGAAPPAPKLTAPNIPSYTHLTLLANIIAALLPSGVASALLVTTQRLGTTNLVRGINGHLITAIRLGRIQGFIGMLNPIAMLNHGAFILGDP